MNGTLTLKKAAPKHVSAKAPQISGTPLNSAKQTVNRELFEKKSKARLHPYRNHI